MNMFHIQSAWFFDIIHLPRLHKHVCTTRIDKISCLFIVFAAYNFD